MTVWKMVLTYKTGKHKRRKKKYREERHIRKEKEEEWSFRRGVRVS